MAAQTVVVQLDQKFASQVAIRACSSFRSFNLVRTKCKINNFLSTSPVIEKDAVRWLSDISFIAVIVNVTIDFRTVYIFKKNVVLKFTDGKIRMSCIHSQLVVHYLRKIQYGICHTLSQSELIFGMIISMRCYSALATATELCVSPMEWY